MTAEVAAKLGAPGPSPVTRPRAGARGSDGLYVYCVARGPGRYLLGPIGLDGADVYTLASADGPVASAPGSDSGGLCVVVQNCRAETRAGRLAGRSEQPDTIERWMLTHQGVVTAATQAFGTVLPMAFNMIVAASEGGTALEQWHTAGENLMAWLDEKRDRFTGLLHKLAGKAEYGVQVFWDPKVITAAVVQRDPELLRIRDEARTKPKGLAYMLQQKLAKAARAALEAQADRHIKCFYAQIRECVEDIRVGPIRRAPGASPVTCPRAGARGSDGGQMLLNLSCLMDRGSAALGRVLDEIQRTEGVWARFTGPWPPYNFVSA